MAYSVQLGECPCLDRALAWRESTALHREMERRRCLLDIVILDSSVYVLDLINIPYLGNIISSFFPQMYYNTGRQLFHQQTICKTEEGSDLQQSSPSGFFIS